MAKSEIDRFMAGLRQVESGNRYHIGPNGSGASGAYQFIDGTWGNYKGYRSAYLAPKAVQDARARQLISQYHGEYKRWDLVAVAWHGGPGAADQARRDPSYTSRLRDSNMTTAAYVQRVMKATGLSSRSGGGGGSDRGRERRPRTERVPGLEPWPLPRDGSERILADPALLDQLGRDLTLSLAVVESVHRRSRAAAAELDVDEVNLADGSDERRLKHALDDALEEWSGLRRLPHLLARDIGFVVEARMRFTGADGGDRAARREIDALVASLGDRTTRRTRRDVGRVLDRLFHDERPRRMPTSPDRRGDDDRSGSGGGGDRGGTSGGVDDVNVGGSWAGTKAPFTQFITPFMGERGLSAGSQKRSYDTVDGPGMSDHYSGSKRSYAVDYPTYSGKDDARALAKALGNDSWQPNNYDSFTTKIGGESFQVQILWGSAIEHGDHVHVGLRRA